MKTDVTAAFDKLIYYRLISLWVLCEDLLAGVIHGFKIPVSGLVVGSSAVICICLTPAEYSSDQYRFSFV